MSSALKGLGVLLVAGVAAYVLWDGRSPPARSEAAELDAAAQAVESPEPQQVGRHGPNVKQVSEASSLARAAEKTASNLSDEASLMAKLRGLGETNPELSIQLAKAGNARFPRSPAAAKRAWIVVKSLVNLGRFHGARDEARNMVERYPGTTWALDVKRHLLVHPLDLSSREEQQEALEEEAFEEQE